MYPDYMIYLFVFIMCIWAFWPMFDFLQVVLGNLPSVENSTIDTVRDIKSKGYLYRYSALKRFKKIPEYKALGNRDLMQRFNSI